MRRRSALLAIGAVAVLPSAGLAGPRGPRRNDPREWSRWWIGQASCSVNPFFPRDGRETIYQPYERFARTDTVGAYLDVSAYLCAQGGPHRSAYRKLPDDFCHYLGQRIPWNQCLWECNQANRIDAFGMIVPA
jgi:hypothetical protein